MKWTGVFPAVTTKMTETGELDLDAMRASLDRLVGNGVSGVIVLPMLGENASLALTERETIIRTAVETVGGRVPVLSGLAEITLDTARANARLYQSWGVQGLMVNAPGMFHSLVGDILSAKTGTFALMWSAGEKGVKVGLRSQRNFDCIALAESMGGGGHAQACGFKMKVERLPELLGGTFNA